MHLHFLLHSEHLLDVKIVPVESSLDTTDTTYSPSNRGDENGRSRKTGRRGSGTGMEKDKLIVIETRNKGNPMSRGDSGPASDDIFFLFSICCF